MNDVPNTEGSPISVQSAPTPPLDTQPTKIETPASLPPACGWVPDFGVPLAVAARALASVEARAPVVLKESPVQIDPRVSNMFRQRFAGIDAKMKPGDPTPRPAGRGEGAAAVGRRVEAAIASLEKKSVRKF
eukprot:jgi/Mesvir1/23314/Mv21010-RA.1